MATARMMNGSTVAILPWMRPSAAVGERVQSSMFLTTTQQMLRTDLSPRPPSRAVSLWTTATIRSHLESERCFTRQSHCKGLEVFSMRHFSSQTVDPHENHDNEDNTNVVPFLLADIGEGIQEVEVLQWFVQTGDMVKEFDTICQVQSDKATVEITSRFAGKVVEISPNTHISVGEPLVHIETDAPETTSAGSAETASSSSVATPPPPTELEQQQLKDHQTTDKGSRLNIPSAPTHYALDSDASGIESDKMDHASLSSSTSSKDATTSTKYLASPAVRKLAADHGINVRAIQGTGPQGRILKADILQFVKQTPQPSSPTPPAPTASSGVKSPTEMEEESKTVVSMKGYNKFMVQSMTDSLQIPHMSLGDEIVVDKLIQFRTDWNASQPDKDDETDEQPNYKLGMQTLLIKACSMALKEHPAVNAKTHNVEQCQVCYHDNHDIGIAMDTPHGLVVPVVRRVNKKSLVEIQHEVNRLKHAAASGTTELSDLVPSPTFTLSNIGAVGVGTHMSPVLVPPLIAMGALGRIQKLPRFDQYDKVVPTHVLYVSWVADHRFLDGASLARFHQSFAKYASNPLLMLPFLK